MFRVILLLGLLGSAPGWAALSRDELYKRYRGLSSFSAEIVQTKTSPYLIKPLLSKARIDYKDERLNWQLEGQEALVVQFSKSGQAQLIAGTSLTKSMPAAALDKLLKTLEAMRDLMLMDPRLEDNFILTLKEQEVLIEPRPGKAAVFFKQIILTFAEPIQLRSMLFKTEDEETKLDFSQLKISQ